MPPTHFDSLHSVAAQGDRFLVKTVDDHRRVFEWTISKEAATLLVEGLQLESTSLHRPDEVRPTRVMAIQPIVSADMTPGLQIQLGEALFLTLSMPRQTLVALKTCIAQLESSTSFGGPRH